MMRLIFILILFFGTSCCAQQYNFTGSVYNSIDSGLSGVEVGLWTKRKVPYNITFPAYPSGLSYNTGTVVSSSDDVVTGPYNIGFTFNFFGTGYTQFYICSNGWIGFSSGQTNGYTAMFLPNGSSPKNVVMGDWEDLYPGSSNIYYSTVGSAPNRKLVVSFYNCPHYSCRTIYYTFQFVLYEGSNVIDLNILSKPLCGSNSATQGLVNLTNTIVVPVGGRNASLWSVSAPETVRFTPSVDTTWNIGKTVYTNSVGYFTFAPSGFDINNFDFRVVIPSVPTFTIGTSDISDLNDIVLRKKNPVAKNYYQYDVNNTGNFTVSDLYMASGRKSGRFSSLSPEYRFFTSVEWSTIKISSSNLKSTIPGTQTVTVYPAPNGGSVGYYCIRTGLKK
jgi:hypothetical protein